MTRFIYSILFCLTISFSSSAQLLAPVSTSMTAYTVADVVAAFQSKAMYVENMNTDNISDDVLALSPLELLGEDKEQELLDEAVEELSTPGNESLKGQLAAYAKKYLGCRYVHGGKGPKVFDCSGFTSYVFRNFGYSLSPASRMQGTQGSRVSGGIKNAEVGDLIFFSGRAGGRTVGHVGMVIEVNEITGAVKFIHASCKKGITIQRFPDGGYYSRHFLHVQRVIDQPQLLAKK